jgi:methionine biosynthesis protein MetW
VLDIGCGQGDLLSQLRAKREAAGMGIDIEIRHLIEVIDQGHDVFQTDVDAGLAMIPDNAYDYAIVSETLQVIRRPRLVMHEMLRVAREGIVAFPNFAHLSHRLRLWLSGRMPKGGALPYEWYETPNIHLFALRDFVDLCARDGIRILDLVCVPHSAVSRRLLSLGLCNLGADRVIMRVSAGSDDDRSPADCRAADGRESRAADGKPDRTPG